MNMLADVQNCGCYYTAVMQSDEEHIGSDDGMLDVIIA